MCGWWIEGDRAGNPSEDTPGGTLPLGESARNHPGSSWSSMCSTSCATPFSSRVETARWTKGHTVNGTDLTHSSGPP